MRIIQQTPCPLSQKAPFTTSRHQCLFLYRISFVRPACHSMLHRGPTNQEVALWHGTMKLHHQLLKYLILLQAPPVATSAVCELEHIIFSSQASSKGAERLCKWSVEIILLEMYSEPNTNTFFTKMLASPTASISPGSICNTWHAIESVWWHHIWSRKHVMLVKPAISHRQE